MYGQCPGGEAQTWTRRSLPTLEGRLLLSEVKPMSCAEQAGCVDIRTKGLAHLRPVIGGGCCLLLVQMLPSLRWDHVPQIPARVENIIKLKMYLMLLTHRAWWATQHALERSTFYPGSGADWSWGAAQHHQRGLDPTPNSKYSFAD